MKKIIERKFSDWTEQELRYQIGLKQIKTSPILEEWIAAKSVVLNQEEMNRLNRLGKRATTFVVGWNEAELRDQFISPLLDLVEFSSEQLEFSAFAERTMEVFYKKYKLYGKVDWMAAQGIFDPVIPFFFLHEYKAEKGKDKDPRGQLLVSMFSAHIANQKAPNPDSFVPYANHFYKNIPIYGAYIIGRFWYFSILEKTKYSFSQAYNITETNELSQILKILKFQKQKIVELLSKEMRLKSVDPLDD